MDFFTAQDQARSKTKLLVFYFFLAVAGIIVSLYFAWIFLMGSGASYLASSQGQPVATSSRPMALWQPEVMGAVALIVIVIVGISSLMKTVSLKSGGGVVARSLGGIKVEPNTHDATERKLRNVVEEMAIASGVPTPEIYLLPESTINGFAAGFTIDDAAIAITRGCVEQLSRDELQGVVAHEFSHILNGDMRLNIRLTGILFGILVIAVAGRFIMRSVWFGAGSSRRDSKGGGAMAIILFGLAVIAIGYIGVFFGRLIQAAVSRQREFLADASAVQFTRNPDGIAGALKKIGGSSSLVENPHAEDTAHFFFASALKNRLGGSFSTHPPLAERIKSIDPGWDGHFLTPKREPIESKKAFDPKKRRKASAGGIGGAVGVMGMADLAYAEETRASIEAELGDALHATEQARALAFALLLDSDTDIQKKQLAFIRDELGQEMATATQELQPKMQALGPERRLPTLEMALPSLAALGRLQAQEFSRRVQHLIELDGRVTLFEFALGQIIKRYLARRFQEKEPPLLSAIGPVSVEFCQLLSAMVYASTDDDGIAAERFEAAARQAPGFRGEARLVPLAELGAAHLSKALEDLARTRFNIRRQVIAALAHAALADGEISAHEGDLLRAVAISLECPLPPTLGLDAQAAEAEA